MDIQISQKSGSQNVDSSDGCKSIVRSDVAEVTNLDMSSAQPANLIYVSQQNLTPILQHLQHQQMAIFENINRQQSRSFIKAVVGMILLFLVLLFSVAGGIYWYFQPVETAQKNMAQNLAQYQQNLSKQFSQEINSLQQNYQKDISQIHAQSTMSHQQLLEFVQRLQKEYQEQMAAEENRKIILFQKQEMLEKTVQELTSSLTKSEITILNLREENRKLQEYQVKLQKLAEKQKEEILQLKKQVAEKLSPEELEKIKLERKDDG